MLTEKGSPLFTSEILNGIFPPGRADQFFEALFADSSEGAYDICLVLRQEAWDRLDFEFHLKQRPGKCLSCSLTYGLPQVFSRHPAIDVKGLVRAIENTLVGRAKCVEWKLGMTREISSQLHTIPLTIFLER